MNEKRTKRTTGRLFQRNARGNYYLAWQFKGQRFCECLGTPNKVAAQREAVKRLAPFQAEAEAEAVAAIAARLERATEHAAALGPSIHLGVTWQAYLDAEKRKTPGPGTLKDYEAIFYTFKRWMKSEHPDTTTMRDVSPDMARAFLKYLERGRELSGDRVNKHLVFLRSMFELLAAPAALPANPWAGINKREHTAAHRRPLTIEEMRTIIETAEAKMKTLFMVGTFTGLRLGDASTLRWDECDLVRAIIHRVPRKTARKGVVVTIGIPAILGAHLAELPRKGPFIMPELARLYLARKEYLSRRVQAHFVKCGIDTQGYGPGKRAACVAGFHSLRHSFVSMHAQAGTSQSIMQKLVGHGNAQMTAHYTSIDEATARTAAAALPAIIGESAPAPEERPPLPAWAVEAVKTAKTLKELRAALMKGIKP